jgi:AcrR family transcriptional regulator
MGLATDKRQKRPVSRIGRPPRELAGEVDDRILDAARQLFLERGLDGASVEEIARRSRAGKHTIYARFPTKEALFAAAAQHNSAHVMARFGSDPICGATIEERLASLGTNILKRLLVGDVLDFMRLAVAEARRFPDLANAGRIIRERSAQAVTRELSEALTADELAMFPALAPERLAATTHFFLDLVVRPLLMRALLGESLNLVRADITTHVIGGVAFFLAACRHHSVN